MLQLDYDHDDDPDDDRDDDYDHGHEYGREQMLMTTNGHDDEQPWRRTTP